VSAADGGPAFPSENEERWYHGMSLRDYFAARVMQAFLSTPAMLCGAMKGNESHDAAAVIAQAAYEQADAMIAQRGAP
jgi:hypothetical protein